MTSEIYGYSKDAAAGKFKCPQKVIKNDRTTEDIAAPVLLKITEHYKYAHLDLDILYLIGVDFLLANSRDIGFIPYKAKLTKSDK